MPAAYGLVARLPMEITPILVMADDDGVSDVISLLSHLVAICVIRLRCSGGNPRSGSPGSDDDGAFGVVCVGERSNFKNYPTHTQDHGDGIATKGESVVHVPS